MISRAIVFDERDVAADVEAHPHVGPLRRRRPPRIDHVEPRPVPDALEQVVEPDRVRRARVRSPQEDDVRLLDFAVGVRASTRAEHRRQTDDARGVSRPVAAVDVVGAEGDAGELLRQEVHLVGGLRAAEDAERVRTTRLDVAAEPLGGAVERVVPGCGTERRRSRGRAAGSGGRQGERWLDQGTYGQAPPRRWGTRETCAAEPSSTV